MYFYSVVIFLSIVFAAMAEITRGNDGRIRSMSSVFISLSGLSLLLPLAARTIGVDYENYLITYDTITSHTMSDYWLHIWTGSPEPLYAMLNYLAKHLYESFQGINILCAIITISFTYMMIYQWKDEINIVMCLWFICSQYYLYCYGLNRMMMAVAIVGWTYKLFFDGKYLQCSIWVVVAGLLHYSALLMFPFYLALHWMKKNYIDLTFHASLKATVVSIAVFVILCRFVPPLLRSFSWFNRYVRYFDISTNIRALNNNLLCYPVILWVIFHFNKIEFTYYQKQLLLIIYVFVALCFVSIILPVHRIIYYFYPAVGLINGIIPKVTRVDAMSSRRKLDSISIDSLVHYVTLFLLGILIIYRTTEVSVLWSPFLVPYRGISFF